MSKATRCTLSYSTVADDDASSHQAAAEHAYPYAYVSSCTADDVHMRLYSLKLDNLITW